MSTKKLEFIFVCPTRNLVFESADFSVLGNKCVIVDAAGNKTLDAKIALSESCPFCGQKHIFDVSELSCPFSE